MGNQQFTISNTARGDTSAFTVPGDEDGGEGEESVTIETSGGGGRRRAYVHVDNGWDVDVDVTLQGSHTYDSGMASAVDDGAAETVSSGTTGAFDTEVGHSYIQVSVTPAVAPTSGDLTVTFQARGG